MVREEFQYKSGFQYKNRLNASHVIPAYAGMTAGMDKIRHQR